MNRTMRDVCVASALIAGVYQPLDACGDKLLLVGRGLKFQRAYASLNPGHVLVYARPTLSANAGIRNTQLHRALRQAGHSVSVIEDAWLLEQALRSTTHVDVVLADVNDANRVGSPRSRLGNGSPGSLRGISISERGRSRRRRLCASSNPRTAR